MSVLHERQEEGKPVEADTLGGSSAFAAPPWARDVGRWSWIIIGVVTDAGPPIVAPADVPAGS